MPYINCLDFNIWMLAEHQAPRGKCDDRKLKKVMLFDVRMGTSSRIDAGWNFSQSFNNSFTHIESLRVLHMVSCLGEHHAQLTLMELEWPQNLKELVLDNMKLPHHAFGFVGHLPASLCLLRFTNIWSGYDGADRFEWLQSFRLSLHNRSPRIQLEDLLCNYFDCFGIDYLGYCPVQFYCMSQNNCICHTLPKELKESTK
jgi:hypothetical protein